VSNILPSSDEYGNEEDLKVNLHAKTTGDIGILRLHNQEQVELLTKADPHNIWGTPVELVAIYRSRVFKNYVKSSQDSGPVRAFGTLENYTVLWVEWKDGVAYHLGIGEVEKAAWEALDPEDISFVMG
jgi:hypothetical protein